MKVFKVTIFFSSHCGAPAYRSIIFVSAKSLEVAISAARDRYSRGSVISAKEIGDLFEADKAVKNG